jgi:hypothetical protein
LIFYAYDTHVVYSKRLGPGRRPVSEAEYPIRKAVFDALGERQLLTETLGKIPDFRKTKYWKKR